ncbi:hypothetical protein [Mycolicibacterium llatzerense]|uniref:hypothetical protein n=1 Tax=Mycolicibacterium llatzerense TaxID=280871 RepID=UPI0013A6D83C|nr:hypothetical protein [Mycolicibacterium llatzerense]
MPLGSAETRREARKVSHRSGGGIFNQALANGRKTGTARAFVAAFNDDPPEPTQSEKLKDYADWVRGLPQLEAEREAQRQSEAEEQAREDMSPIALLSEALKQANAAPVSSSSPSNTLPLNGIELLRSALSGPGVTINGSASQLP